jgi:hypothetical protein
MENYWLNTAKYSNTELILFGIGAFFWILCYIFVIRGIIKHKFVGISASVVGANIAWEFLWAFVFRQDMGQVIQIGYYGWFLLDVFIVYSMFKYGYKQVLPQNQKYFRLFFAYSILAWVVILYFFIKEGYDNEIGANSAYAIQLLISASCLGMMDASRTTGKGHFIYCSLEQNAREPFLRDHVYHALARQSLDPFDGNTVRCYRYLLFMGGHKEPEAYRFDLKTGFRGAFCSYPGSGA